MKLALYYPWLHTRGGAERVVLEYVKNSKHDVTIFTNYYTPEKTFDEFKNCKIVTLSNGNIESFFTRAMIGLNMVIKKIKQLEEFDAMILYGSGITELVAIRNHDIPILIYTNTPLRVAHSMYEETIASYKNPIKKLLFFFGVSGYKILEKIAWKKASSIASISEEAKRRAVKAGLTSEDKIKVIYVGVDTSKFKVSTTQENYFFVPGRFKKYKRFELAIKSFNEFVKVHEDFKLVIAGSQDDKNYIEYLKSISSQNVEIRTSLSDQEMLDLYEKCFALLFTAKNEDWGIVPLEAMACGKPVISVSEGGPLEYIESGENGLLVNADEKEMTEAMERLVADKDLLERIISNAPKTVERFKWTEMAEKLDKEMENLAR